MKGWLHFLLGALVAVHTLRIVVGSCPHGDVHVGLSNAPLAADTAVAGTLYVCNSGTWRYVCGYYYWSYNYTLTLRLNKSRLQFAMTSLVKVPVEALATVLPIINTPSS